MNDFRLKIFLLQTPTPLLLPENMYTHIHKKHINVKSNYRFGSERVSFMLNHLMWF